MEGSKLERFILLGAVPIVAACVGSVVTVLAGHYFAATPPSEAMVAVLKLEGISPDQRLKLLEQVNLTTKEFYGFLNKAAMLLLFPTGGILWAWAARIRG